MRHDYERYLWLFELLLEEPKRVSDLERSTGINRNIINDCCYELAQRGVIVIKPDSTMVIARNK